MPVDQRLVRPDAARRVVRRVTRADFQAQLPDRREVLQHRHHGFRVVLVDLGVAGGRGGGEQADGVDPARGLQQGIRSEPEGVLASGHAHRRLHRACRQVEEVSRRVHLDDVLLRFGQVLHLRVDGIDAVLRCLEVLEDRQATRALGGEEERRAGTRVQVPAEVRRLHHGAERLQHRIVLELGDERRLTVRHVGIEVPAGIEDLALDAGSRSHGAEGLGRESSRAFSCAGRARPSRGIVAFHCDSAGE